MQLLLSNVKCGGCATTIEDALTAMSGIKMVNVDVGRGLVEIHGEGYSLADVEQKLTELGYPVKK